MPPSCIYSAAFFPAPNLLPLQSVENCHSLWSQLHQTSSLLSRGKSLLFPPLLCLTPEIPVLFCFFSFPVSGSRAGHLPNVCSAKSEQHTGRRTAEIAGSKLSPWNCIWRIGSWVLRGYQVLSFSVSSHSFSFSYYWNCFYIKKSLWNQEKNWSCICYLWVNTFNNSINMNCLWIH